MKSRPTPITKEEIKSILEAAKEDDFDYLMYSVLKTTGRRIGELYGIEKKKKTGEKKTGYKKKVWTDSGKQIEVDKVVPIYKVLNQWALGVKVKDLDFEAGIMKTWVLKRRDYVQDETVLMPEIVQLLKKYIRQNKLKLEDYVFRKKGRGMRQIKNVIKTYAKKAGVTKNVSIHSFRHYFITELKRQGWPNEKIAKVTGHKSVNTIGIYDHVLAKDMREDIHTAIVQL